MVWRESGVKDSDEGTQSSVDQSVKGPSHRYQALTLIHISNPLTLTWSQADPLVRTFSVHWIFRNCTNFSEMSEFKKIKKRLDKNSSMC